MLEMEAMILTIIDEMIAVKHLGELKVLLL